MAVEAARGQVVENIVNLIACMVVLIACCCVEVLVSTRGSLRVVSLLLEAAERPAA